MERGASMLDFETVDAMVQVHDYLGVTMSSRDANSKQAASEASSIFGAHYPEFLVCLTYLSDLVPTMTHYDLAQVRKYFVNVPAVMSWIFWLFKPIIPSQTFAKMEVCGKGQREIFKALNTEIDEKQIPQRYGGLLDAF
jgi:phosphatidylinositol transfer protein SFH5